MNPLGNIVSFIRTRRAPRSLQEACSNLQNNAAVVLQATATFTIGIIGLVVGTQMQNYSTPCFPKSSSLKTPSPSTEILPEIYQSLSKGVSATSLVLLVISLGNTLNICSSQTPYTPSRRQKIKKCLDILSVILQTTGATSAIASTALGCSCFDGKPSDYYSLAAPLSKTGGLLHTIQALTLLASSLLVEQEKYDSIEMVVVERTQSNNNLSLLDETSLEDNTHNDNKDLSMSLQEVLDSTQESSDDDIWYLCQESMSDDPYLEKEIFYLNVE